MDGFWLAALALIERTVALALIGHVVLNKRDVGSAIGWGCCLTSWACVTPSPTPIAATSSTATSRPTT